MALARMDSEVLRQQLHTLTDRASDLRGQIQQLDRDLDRQKAAWHVRLASLLARRQEQEDQRFANDWARALLADVYLITPLLQTADAVSNLTMDPAYGGWVLEALHRDSAFGTNGRKLAKASIDFVSGRPYLRLLGSPDLQAWLQDGQMPLVVETGGESLVEDPDGRSGAVLELGFAFASPGLANEIVIEPWGLEAAELVGIRMNDEPWQPWSAALDGLVVIPIGQRMIRRLVLRLRQRHAFVRPYGTALPAGRPDALQIGYRFSLRRVDVRYTSFAASSTAIFDLASFGDDVRALSLVADADIPYDGDRPMACVLYDVRHHEGDWIPIHPINEPVAVEPLSLVFVDGRYEATLRHRPDPAKPIVIWRDDRPVQNGYSVDPASRRIIFSASAFDAQAVYTVCYTPDATATKVSAFDGDAEIALRTISEELVADAAGFGMELSYTPWIDRASLFAQPEDWDPSYLSVPGRPDHYVPIRLTVELPDGAVWSQPPIPGASGLFLLNRTDYRKDGRTFVGAETPVVIETVTLSGEGWVRLSMPFILADTVEVFDDQRTYAESVDYVVDAEKSRIRRIAAGAIPDGASVQVRYRWSGNPYGPEPVEPLQYQIVGRSIRFNRPLPAKTRVVARYTTFAPAWQLRVTAMRLLPSDPPVTPVIRRMAAAVFRVGVLRAD